MAAKKRSKPSPLDILNRVRDKARLNETPYQQIQVIKMKTGKIKFQLLALDADYLFAQRRQHAIPPVPHDDDPNNKWMVVNCLGDGCPICKAADAFKQSGVEIEDVNAEYKPKYPYKNLRSVFTQPEHYLLCAKILVDQCEDGNYLPKDAEIGSTQFIQFSRTALNNLMSAYEDFVDDYADSHEDEEAPALFAIFDGEDSAESLTVTCRITNQPFSATFSFSKVQEVSADETDNDKLEMLEKGFEEPNEDYVAKCIKRVKQIHTYFTTGGPVIDDGGEDDPEDLDDDDDLPFTMGGNKKKVSESKGSKGGKKKAPIEDEDEDEEAEDEAAEEEEEEDEEEKVPPKKSAKKTGGKKATASKSGGQDGTKDSPDDDLDDFDLDDGDL